MTEDEEEIRAIISIAGNKKRNIQFSNKTSGFTTRGRDTTFPEIRPRYMIRFPAGYLNR